MDGRDARRRCCCEGEEHMIEQKILMWSLGFTVGVMTTIAVDKIVERDVLPPHSEAV